MRQLTLPGVLLAVASLVLATAAAPRGEAAPKPPGAAVCVPKTIRMEYFSSLGARLGEYDARFQEIAKVYPNDPYSYKCVWYASAPKDEAFVVFIGITPPGVPGRITAGNCDGTRKDSYPFYNSRTRYLGVSGGNRKEFQNAVGGNDKILKGVLAAAEAAGVGMACSKAKPPQPPSPPPPPKPAPGQLGIDYRMPARFGDEDANGLLHYPTVGEIAPDGWIVYLDVRRKDGRPCDRGDPISVTADGVVLTPRSLERVGRCRVQARLPREGRYRVVVRMKTERGILRGERDILVQDWLIVGLGDSNGSGEGTPDIPSSHAGRVRWQSQRCDRSANSYQAQTALTLEERDKRTSVTFVHLACSGASVVKGLLGGYEGIVPLRPDLPPQVDAMRNLAQGREIDAVIVSVGINDLGFAQLVLQCLTKPDCPSSKFPDSTSPTTLAQVMQQRLDSLPLRYSLLAEALRERRVDPSRVYVTEYFDSTHSSDGKTFCNPLIDTPGSLDFTQAEAEYAYKRILVPLNAAVAKAAKVHKWRVVTGSARRFREHGYCSSDPWIVGLVESFANQANQNGTLHANVRGNREQASLVVPKIRSDFYAAGRTRAPR
jgi:hypothetical protein